MMPTDQPTPLAAALATPTPALPLDYGVQLCRALDLDPDRVEAITLTATSWTATVLAPDAEGRPQVVNGEVLTHTIRGQVVA